jgi:hypothetical protein
LIGTSHRFERQLGDEVPVTIIDPHANFNAVVKGVDRYTEHTLSGRVNTWVSYTVVAEQAPEGHPAKRFYLVDGQEDAQTGEAFARRSVYTLDNNTEVPSGHELDQNLSGYVELKSEGDAQLSSGAGAIEGNSVSRGSLATFRSAGGDIWAREVFDQSAPLSFRAIFEKPGQEL